MIHPAAKRAFDLMTTLTIRHRLVLDGDRYVVIENFGDQPERRFDVANKADGELLIARRKARLLEMVSEISDEAKEAVEQARHIDNLKAGNA